MLADHGADWDSDLPTREAILYLAGATSTTSNAVNHAVFELDGWLADHPEDRDRLGDDAFLRGVCNEALRLRQNVTALARRATREITLSTGRTVGEGEIIALDFIAANQDPEVFGGRPGPLQPAAPGAGRRAPVRPRLRDGAPPLRGAPARDHDLGKPAGEGEADRALLRILRALLEAGIELDPVRPPRYAPTAEPVFESLPVLLTARPGVGG